jgi:serine/threonine-protein kinase
VEEALVSPPAGEVFLEDPPAPGPYSAGDRICGKYRLVDPIGFGGMGNVWRAHNEVLDAPVALKLIRSDARWSGSSERLLFEARAAAALRHPSIVRVFDFGKTRHRDPFIVMELLQGESLRDVLDRQGTLTAVEALRVLLPILGGIGCAHARGIVHRDLKPENIFLARDDTGSIQPKILDFGIAKLEGSVSHLTTGGILLGSPEYMSPEQAIGEQNVDHRIDIWSSAVVLYEMIAGRAPWECTNCPALLRAIVDDAPPCLVGRGGVDAPLWAIIERGLAKKRDKRWSSARNFGRALAGWLAARSITDDVTGASLRVVWLGSESGETSALPEDAPVVRSQEGVETGLSISAFLRHTGRRKKVALGLTTPFLASLALFGLAHFSRRAPAATPAPTMVVAPSAVDVPRPTEPLEPVSQLGELTATRRPDPFEPDAAALVQPGHDRTVERPRAKPTKRETAKPPASNAAPATSPTPKGPAQSMDFGF